MSRAPGVMLIRSSVRRQVVWLFQMQRQNSPVHLQCYFTRSLDMSTFLEDMRLIRPTEMLAPPRITSMMYDHFQELLGAKSASSPEDRERQRQASPAFTEPGVPMTFHA